MIAGYLLISCDACKVVADYSLRSRCLHCGGDFCKACMATECVDGEDDGMFHVLDDREPPEDDGECFRGGEAAAYASEQQARIQREVK